MNDHKHLFVSPQNLKLNQMVANEQVGGTIKIYLLNIKLLSNAEKMAEICTYISLKNIILNKFNKTDTHTQKKMPYDRICVEFYNR